jgi:RNA polymerase sigma factor (sigma-70 family)
MPPVSTYRQGRPAELNFEDLIRPQVEYLYRLAWRFTGNVSDAEDLLQDVLIKVYPLTQEMLAIQKLRPWLAKVLYHQYVDSVRQRKRSPVLELVSGGEGDDNPLDKIPATREGPEQDAERAGQRDRILAAVRQLNPEQRAVIAMHDIEGYSLEELEKMLETPIGTLKSRLHRARQRLRALLPMEPISGRERVNG